MALVPSQKNPSAVLKQFRTNIQTYTGLNNFDRDSKIRSLVDVLNNELLELRQQTVNAFNANQLSNSSGADLVKFGESRGVQKRFGTFASVTKEELSLAFYVESGTFGDINGGNSIVIPQGTVVYSAPNNNELGSTINFLLDEEYVLPATGSLVYVGAIAETSGSFSNVGQGVLTNHKFTDYADSVNNTLKVINFFPVLNGRDTESDSQYRFRISQHYNRLHQNSDTRILLTSLEVPGVLSVKAIPGYFGIGTVGVVVLGVDNKSNSSLLEQVQAKLNRYQGPAGLLKAIPAVEVSFDIHLRLRSTKALTLAERNTVQIQARKYIIAYFRSIGIGGIVQFEDLALQLQTNINGLVQVSPREMYKDIFVSRMASNGVFSEKEQQLSKTHFLSEDEYPDLGNLDIEYL